jgi:RNA polymerase I-specific transcription initiation factor RRN3
MSVFSFGTTLTATNGHNPNRNLVKAQLLNRNRSENINSKGKHDVKVSLENFLLHKNRQHYDDLVLLLRDTQLKDEHVLRVLAESRKCMELLRSTRVNLFVESLLELNWLDRNHNVITEYQQFLLDLLVSQVNYSKRTMSMLISHFTRPFDPTEPTSTNYKHLSCVHDSIDQILEIIPATFKMVSQEIYSAFPYHNQTTEVFAAYINNSFWLLRYRPIFTEDILNMLMKQLVMLDTRLPRDELEEDEDASISAEMLFDMEDDAGGGQADRTMLLPPLAETLDQCMGMVFEYLTSHFHTHPRSKMFDTLFNIFVDSILLTYNSHHVQFILFYYCSLRADCSEQFIHRLWHKTCDFNETPLIRQAAIDYLSGFLARAKFLSLATLQDMLTAMCQFAHTYISRCDSAKNHSLKGHTVFFSICQAIFYLVAFRSKELFASKKNILFLQSLQLSQIVNCRLNPLLVTKPAIVTAFASITRAHQLAYCYTIMERNSRRKLATIYTDATQMPDECLKSIFPFDPYLLKRSSKFIAGIYQEYESCVADEEFNQTAIVVPTRHEKEAAVAANLCMSVEDGDDFLTNRNKNLIFDSKFSYGSSPGFH